MRNLRAPILVLGLFLTAGCFEIEHEEPVSETVQKEWPAGEIRTLDVEGLNGSITIVGDSEERLTMTAEVRSRRPAAEVLETRIEGGSLVVREHHGRRRSFPFGIIGHSGIRIDYEFHVPAGLELEVETTNGRIEALDVRGEQNLESVNGRIETTTPNAYVVAGTVNGRIVANFTEEFRGARLRTVNGSVRVSVPRDSAISADVDTVNGSFNSNIPVAVNSKRSADDAGPREYPLDVTTVNGSVTLSEWSGRRPEV